MRNLLVLAALVVIVLAGGVSSRVAAQGRTSGPKQRIESSAIALRIVKDEPYRTDAAKTDFHKVDFYAPIAKPTRPAPAYPMVVFFHGGAWIAGDKESPFERLPEFARSLAEAGIVVAMANYRLAPQFKAAMIVDDCARAVAHAASRAEDFGADPTRIFLAGHSAGAHLAALLATNPKPLQTAGFDAALLRGVVCLSGVYHFNGLAGWAGRPFLAHGDKTAVSPLAHVRKGLPPFLVLSAENDLPGLRRHAERLRNALVAAEVPVDHREVKKLDHVQIMLAAGFPRSEVATAIRFFVQTGRLESPEVPPQPLRPTTRRTRI